MASNNERALTEQRAETENDNPVPADDKASNNIADTIAAAGSNEPESSAKLNHRDTSYEFSENNSNLFQETKLLRDTLDLLWNQTLEQRNLREQLERENEHLQDYISNLMTSSNVLDK